MNQAVAETHEACSSLLASRGGADDVLGIVGAVDLDDSQTGAPVDGFDLAEGGKWGGLVVVLLAAGRGLAYLMNWQGARDDRRSAKMREWEESLQRREKEYRERIEKDIKLLHADVAQLRGTVARVCNAGSGLALELHKYDASSEALERWRKVLGDAFPQDAVLPSDMSELILKLHRQSDEGARS